MNTQAHLIFGLTAFGKPARPSVTAAALAGAIIPDLSLYLLVISHIFILGTDPEYVFRTLYYSEEWQAIFRVDNSFILWGLGLAFAVIGRSPVFIALCGAALLHLVLDFPFHNDDARAHFWPVTNWKFISPISYWDQQYHGQWVGFAEVAAVLTCCWVLWRRFTTRGMRVFLGLVAAVELAWGIALLVSLFR